MKTKTDWPSKTFDAVIAAVIVIIVALAWVALMRSVADDYQHIQPGVKSSSDQTILPTAEPGSKIVIR